MQYKNFCYLSALFFFCFMITFVPVSLLAGNLDSPADPTDSGSAMHTLVDIYNRLNNNTTSDKRAGGFTEPSAGPASTGHTLDQIYDLALPTKVEKTGQTTQYRPHDDGALGKGVAWPDPRFTDNGDGTVTDNLTGLVWLKNANCGGTKDWDGAVDYAAALKDDDCGLSDGSAEGDWRLPNVKELQSLIDFSQYDPALPSGHPFSGVQANYYWSSTTKSNNPSFAWHVSLYNGNVHYGNKTNNYCVWPVRGGQ